MEQFEVHNLDELNAIISQFDENVLYRGQNSIYGSFEEPAVKASFDRDECCDQSKMIKWIHYAESVLGSLVGDNADDDNFVQALLQHYGWRSFFVDCSTSPAVSAWFASHEYYEPPNPVTEMCEDCYENPIRLEKRRATYNYKEGDGYLYILDKSIASNVGLVDLAVISSKGARLRTSSQCAWLLGPLKGKPVPQNCFLAQIKASRSLFKQFAELHGLTDTNSLFPSPAEDPILDALLGLPWHEIVGRRGILASIPVFSRTLSLPEYHDSYKKIAHPKIAFFRRSKIAGQFDSLETTRGVLTGGRIIAAPPLIIYGVANNRIPLRIPKIERLLEGNAYIAFEIDELIRYVNMGFDTVYQKGIGVVSHGPGLIEVCGLVVRHPGIIMLNAGFSPGLFYRRESDGSWVRELHSDECGCGNEKLHNRHLSALRIAEDLLKDCFTV
ncbi:TPA: FRG domain-containing protein [Escherichia coli]|nr:FRG domain-containing protein [Escherichia coli]